MPGDISKSTATSRLLTAYHRSFTKDVEKPDGVRIGAQSESDIESSKNNEFRITSTDHGHTYTRSDEGVTQSSTHKITHEIRVVPGKSFLQRAVNWVTGFFSPKRLHEAVIDHKEERSAYTHFISDLTEAIDELQLNPGEKKAYNREIVKLKMARQLGLQSLTCGKVFSILKDVVAKADSQDVDMGPLGNTAKKAFLPPATKEEA